MPYEFEVYEGTPLPSRLLGTVLSEERAYDGKEFVLPKEENRPEISVRIRYWQAGHYHTPSEYVRFIVIVDRVVKLSATEAA